MIVDVRGTPSDPNSVMVKLRWVNADGNMIKELPAYVPGKVIVRFDGTTDMRDNAVIGDLIEQLQCSHVVTKVEIVRDVENHARVLLVSGPPSESPFDGLTNAPGLNRAHIGPFALADVPPSTERFAEPPDAETMKRIVSKVGPRPTKLGPMFMDMEEFMTIEDDMREQLSTFVGRPNTAETRREIARTISKAAAESFNREHRDMVATVGSGTTDGDEFDEDDDTVPSDEDIRRTLGDVDPILGAAAIDDAEALERLIRELDERKTVTNHIYSRLRRGAITKAQLDSLMPHETEALQKLRQWGIAKYDAHSQMASLTDDGEAISKLQSFNWIDGWSS